MINLSRLEEITDLGTVWGNEASEFTPWLAKEENIALLAETLDLEGITVEETESDVGDFRADILASETETGRKIIIENQLKDTNHDHLGKLITYAAGKSANIIIWVVKHAREEHRAAVEWLNEHTDENIGFFLCEIKLYRIGDSAPAVKFEVIEKPNDWTKEIRKESSTKFQAERYDYWFAFKEYAFGNESFKKAFSRLKISDKTEIYPAMGTAACRMTISQVRKGKENPELEVYIRVWEETNFLMLLENKDAIEGATNLNFNWKEKGHRIIAAKQFNFNDKTDWQKQFDWLIDTMVKMKEAFKNYL